jgi:hypothetical protein
VAKTLDVERRLIVDHLPASVRWEVGGVPLAYDFCRARTALTPVADEIDERWMREEWEALVVFGRSDYDGGAAPLLTIDADTGWVMGLCLERDEEPLYLFNTSVLRFIEAFRYLNAFLGSGNPVPSDAEAVVRGIDEVAYPTSDWRLFVEYLAELSSARRG